VFDTELPQLDRPVVFVWGTEDDVYPPTVDESACQQLSNGRLEVVSNTGHFVWLDAPDHTAETLAEFLG
jgi:pimeloyl-ACP methyl ester carboxylesterase